MQTWDLFYVLLNLVDLNLVVVQGLLKNKIKIVKSDTSYTSQLMADMVGISKASALHFW